MRKIISFMHVSLDGYVAGPNGELNWAKVDEELFDFVELRISKTDTAMYGRKTYELMESYWPTAADKPNPTKHEMDHSKWYKDVRKIVLSKSLDEAGLSNTKIIHDNLAENIHKIKQEEGSEILLFGSPTATHALMQENLIDGFWLFVNPIILGNGMPLFENVKEKMELKLKSTRQFSSGVVEMDYVRG